MFSIEKDGVVVRPWEMWQGDWSRVDSFENCIEARMNDNRTPEPVRNAIHKYIFQIKDISYKDPFGYKNGMIIFAYGGKAYKLCYPREEVPELSWDAWCHGTHILLQNLKDAGCYAIYDTTDLDVM